MTSLGCRLGTDKVLVEERCFTEWQCSDNCALPGEWVAHQKLTCHWKAMWSSSTLWLKRVLSLDDDVALTRQWRIVGSEVALGAEQTKMEYWLDKSTERVPIWQVRELTWQVSWMMNGKCGTHCWNNGQNNGKRRLEKATMPKSSLQRRMMPLEQSPEETRLINLCKKENHLQCGQP